MFYLNHDVGMNEVRPDHVWTERCVCILWDKQAADNKSKTVYHFLATILKVNKFTTHLEDDNNYVIANVTFLLDLKQSNMSASKVL